MTKKKHIVFSGGLGNQMFQYAFLLSMRERGISCIVDTSMYSIADMHNGFEIVKDFGLHEEVKEFSQFHIRLIQIINRFKPKFLAYKDRVYQYCEDVYLSKQPYLFGDWISEQYFRGISQKVIEAFSFANVKEKNIKLADELQNHNSVSVHIRRGDYLKLPNYCVCDDDYYSNAINFIKDKVDNPVFYVFSNEPSWCNSFMMKFGVNFKIIDWNHGEDSYQDMYLMTQCKHNIIANSTFSWWGGWLNQNEDKIVVAPKYWFRFSDHMANCEGWHLIETR